MTYRDVTLAPDDIEWHRVDVWDAVRFEDDFEEYIEQVGLKKAIWEFARQHRTIADKCIQHPNPPWEWVCATKRFKRARIKAFKVHEGLYGVRKTDRLRKEVREKYPRIDGR